MELGMIGLGRMGGNMAQRLLRSGHKVVAYDPQAEAVQSLLVPAPAEAFRTRIVSKWVNSARNEGPDCIEPTKGSLL